MPTCQCMQCSGIRQKEQRLEKNGANRWEIRKRGEEFLTSSEERQAGKHLSLRQIKMGRENMLNLKLIKF